MPGYSHSPWYLFIQLYHWVVQFLYSSNQKIISCHEVPSSTAAHPQDVKEFSVPNELSFPIREALEPKIRSLSTVLRELSAQSPELKCAAIEIGGDCQMLVNQEYVQDARKVLEQILQSLKRHRHDQKSRNLLSKTVLQLTQICLCDKHARHKDLYDHAAYGKWIDELCNENLELLSEMGICLDLEPVLFKGNSDKTFSEELVDDNVKKTLWEVLKKKEKGEGYLYVMSYHRAPGMFKVGITSGDATREKRRATHMHCYPGYKEVISRRFFYVRRLEKLLFAELGQYSLKEKCLGCDGGHHREWIKVSQEILLERIEKWTPFFSNEGLYDEEGRYNKQGEWDDILHETIRSRPARPAKTQSQYLTPPSKCSRRLSSPSSDPSSGPMSTGSYLSSMFHESRRSVSSFDAFMSSPGEQSPSPAPRGISALKSQLSP